MTLKLGAVATSLATALLVATLATCAPAPSETISTSATPAAPTASTTLRPEAWPSTASPMGMAAAATCALPTIVIPTMPAQKPGYAQLDATTGLHVTGSAREIDLATYRIEVTGTVDNPLSLTYNDLRCMPRVSVSPLLVCPGFFEDQATWAGAPLSHILEVAAVGEEATHVRLVGADLYQSTVSLEQVRSTEAFLAYEWEGEPLPILHGFPVRAVFPTLEGNKWVKWLVKIEAY